ncbi:hypothetical protein [Streptomyces tendae]|uniref:hypothetical protein n=1 Tax=Streptomyces tendae TaxID=1932 RepID=UPI003EC042F7
MSTTPSRDARAVVEAVDRLTTQVRRLADTQSTPVTVADDAPTTTARRPVVGIDPSAEPGMVVAQWLPMSEQQAEEANEASSRIQQWAAGADEETCLAHVKGACDGTTQDCGFTTDTGRANVLRVLVDRAARGVLNDHEATLLRQRAEQVITARATWKAKAEEIERDRDQHCAELEQAQAAIKRVRGLLAGRWGAVDPDRVLAALDGTDQPTTKEN